MTAGVTSACQGPWVVEDPKASRFRVARRTFTDDAILALERDAIFERSWLYVGHTSELAEPNDFIARSVANRELIFNKDRAGKVCCFYNTCPHRGAQVVREPRGNAMAFRCFYHGWAFNNNGSFATRFTEGNYPTDFNSDGCADLKAVTAFDEYRGFCFVNFSGTAPPLEDYLAGAKEFLDLTADQGELGMEIVSGEQQYSIRANWKLLVENSLDGYHAPTTHSTYFDYLKSSTGGFADMSAAAAMSNTAGRAYDLGNGHAVVENLAPWGRPVANWIPAWGENGRLEIERIKQRLVDRFGADRADRMARLSRNLIIFPNLVINDVMSLTVRTFYPLAPDYMRVNAWALAPRGESERMRELRLLSFLEFLGPGGFATPDDNEALELCQKGYRNQKDVGWNDISKGMLRTEPHGDDEAQMRAFWREWARRTADAPLSAAA